MMDDTDSPTDDRTIWIWTSQVAKMMGCNRREALAWLRSNPLASAPNDEPCNDGDILWEIRVP